MATWLLLLAQALELGLWFRRLAGGQRQHEKTRAQLVWGQRSLTRLPFIDERLRASAGIPTRLQSRVAKSIVHAARWATHTQAFELAVLKAVRRRLPIGGRLDASVRLI